MRCARRAPAGEQSRAFSSRGGQRYRQGSPYRGVERSTFLSAIEGRATRLL